MTVFGLTTTNIALAVGSLLVGVGLTALYYQRVRLRLDEETVKLEEKALAELDGEDGVGYGVELAPPDVGRSILDLFKVWWHLRQSSRLAKRGYIKWYRLGSRLHKPKWIKPEQKGAGQYEYQEDGKTYVFPEEALVTDAKTSAYVAMHKMGEAEPIDLRNPGWATLGPDTLQTFVDMVISREPPGTMSSLPLSSQQLKFVGLAVAGLGIWLAMRMTGAFG